MGLDVTAYSNLRYIGHHEIDDDSEHPYDPETFERLHVEAYSYKEFERHALAGIPNHRDEQWGDQKGVKAGCFELTDKTERHAFCAGSYGGYNRWRRDLADQFNPYRDNGDSPPSAEGPFYELIWFADNEGTLGQLAAINLLAAFRQHEVEYRAAHLGTELGDYSVAKYADWMRACELAADGGLIDFH